MGRVRKALIPAAGLGTRMFPATKAVKKELLPMVTPEGVCKPILQSIVEEAYDAGCEDIAIIVRPSDRALISGYFTACDASQRSRLPEAGRRAADRLAELSAHVSYVEQHEQCGFGHAVHCARSWAGDEPVLLLLGDHLYASNTRESCASQLLSAFGSSPEERTMLSLYRAPGASVCHYGTAAGRWTDATRLLLAITEFSEKPSVSYAREHLQVEGLPDDTYLCVYGQYVLTPEVFAILGDQIAGDVRLKGEFQLTTALDALRRTTGLYGFMVDGEHYDTGQPLEYLQSIAAYASHRVREA